MIDFKRFYRAKKLASWIHDLTPIRLDAVSKVLKSFDDENLFRTIEGIARSTELEMQIVSNIIDDLIINEIVSDSHFKNLENRTLYYRLDNSKSIIEVERLNAEKRDEEDKEKPFFHKLKEAFLNRRIPLK